MAARNVFAAALLLAGLAVPPRLSAQAPLRPDNLPADLARSIAMCWRPPHDGDEITLRMSFRRDGSVFGKPRITYMRASGGADGKASLATSIDIAIRACCPLRFTPSLGAAIAGRVFLIRFVAPRGAQRAANQQTGRIHHG